jgi:hypothetical protein
VSAETHVFIWKRQHSSRILRNAQKYYLEIYAKPILRRMHFHFTPLFR